MRLPSGPGLSADIECPAFNRNATVTLYGEEVTVFELVVSAFPWDYASLLFTIIEPKLSQFWDIFEPISC